MKKRSVTPRTGRKSKLTHKLLPSPAVHPSSPAAALALTEAQANRKALMSEALGAATGVGPNEPVANLLLAQFNSILPGKGDIKVALFMLAELRPKNMLETMLVTQMVGVHEAALGFLRTSTNALSEEGCDQNVSRATRFMRLFNEQLELLERLKGRSGQQRVTVEHVHVNAGGQAIVGVVGPPPAALPAAESAQKLLPRPGGVKKKTDG